MGGWMVLAFFGTVLEGKDIPAGRKTTLINSIRVLHRELMKMSCNFKKLLYDKEWRRHGMSNVCQSQL